MRKPHRNINQITARMDAMLDVLRTVRIAIEFHDHWKPSMADTLYSAVDDVISEEERMRGIDAKDA